MTLTPRDEADLAEAIAGATGPLSVRGGATRQAALPEGTPLTTQALTGITLYEPGALTMVARAGTPLDEITGALAAEGQRLAFEPTDLRPLLGTEGAPTIGGVFATNAAGPRRMAVGAARDHLLGVRFVDGQGTILKNGGRVMKNVTGYDLVKLMAGSHGTLGVMTEVSFKVLPAPETQGELMLHGLDTPRAVAAMSAALGTPWEVTGASFDAEAGLTRLRIEGTEASVAYRLGRLAEALQGFGPVETGCAGPADWAALRDRAPWAGTGADVWRVSCRPSAAPGIVAAMGEGTRIALDWGGALIWAATAPGTDLRARLGAFDGHATRLRGQGAAPRFQPPSAGEARLAAAIRATFDPRGLLNPGLMG